MNFRRSVFCYKSFIFVIQNVRVDIHRFYTFVCRNKRLKKEFVLHHQTFLYVFGCDDNCTVTSRRKKRFCITQRNTCFYFTWRSQYFTSIYIIKQCKDNCRIYIMCLYPKRAVNNNNKIIYI